MRGRVSREQLAFSFDEPTTAASPYTVVCDDVLRWAKETPPIGAHAMLVDPPYELGFMGKSWDRSGIAFKPETWKALAQHLLPGAFIMAFASSRGWHRLACAMEDAGLRIYPSLFGWANGSSFPKATRIDVQVDKAAGAMPEIIGHRDSRSVHDGYQRVPRQQFDDSGSVMNLSTMRTLETLTAPATPLAQIWAGHRYGGQMLKNSLEPIIVAQVPYAGKPVQSIVEHGSGAMWIDGSRVGVGEQWWERGDAPPDAATALMQGVHGRWPPNFALQHHPGCVAQRTRQVQTQWGQATERTTSESSQSCYHPRRKHDRSIGYTDANGMEEVPAYQCHDSCVVRKLDLQAGVRESRPGRTKIRGISDIFSGLQQDDDSSSYPGDTGGPSRFFHVSSWSLDVAERLAQADPVRYCAKASRGERDSGLEGMPAQRNGTGALRSEQGGEYQAFVSPAPTGIGTWLREQRLRAGLSVTDVAASFPSKTGGLTGCVTNWECEYNRPTPDQWLKLKEVIGFDGVYDEVMTTLQPVPHAERHGPIAIKRNSHPTVKPIKLTQWLATLLLPPADYAPRRLLIPFSGSGSEGIGAMLAGWDEIVMVDSDQSYVDISTQRLAYWSTHRGATP